MVSAPLICARLFAVRTGTLQEILWFSYFLSNLSLFLSGVIPACRKFPALGSPARAISRKSPAPNLSTKRFSRWLAHLSTPIRSTTFGAISTASLSLRILPGLGRNGQILVSVARGGGL